MLWKSPSLNINIGFSNLLFVFNILFNFFYSVLVQLELDFISVTCVGNIFNFHASFLVLISHLVFILFSSIFQIKRTGTLFTCLLFISILHVRVQSTMSAVNVSVLFLFKLLPLCGFWIKASLWTPQPNLFVFLSILLSLSICLMCWEGRKHYLLWHDISWKQGVQTHWKYPQPPGQMERERDLTEKERGRQGEKIKGAWEVSVKM